MCSVSTNKPENEPSVCSISNDMTDCELPVSLVSVHELPVCPVPTNESEYVQFDYISVNEFDSQVSVCPVSMNESDCELSASLVFLTKMSTSPVSVDALAYEQYICTNVAVRSDLKLSADLVSVNTKSSFEPSIYPVSVTEMSTNPASVNTTNFELSIYPLSAHEFISKQPTSPVSLNESGFELFSCSVSIREPDYELSARETID